jgi:branched-chain amino acid transport system ATP-binding protein
MLTVRGIDCYYGKMHVLRGASLEVGEESVGLFGPNGAGKTTLINAVLGMVRPRRGEILFDGQPIHGLPTHEIARRGISLVPQDRELFPFMTVHGNLEAGAAYIPGAAAKSKESLELVFGLFPVLQKRMKQAAGTLSGGEQRMLAVGRALMGCPRLLILDEPSLGLQPSLVSELYAKLAEMRGRISILVTEQNVRASLKAVERGYVLENGSIAFQDTAEGLARNPHVIKSYLGL